MNYLSELRTNVRPLAAAGLGCGSGLMLVSYVSTVLAPYLIEAFGWSRSQFALIGLTMVLSLFALPLIGRMADRVGVRRTAIVGVIGVPLCLAACSVMTGSFAIFLLITTVLLLLGSFSTPMVYTRLIAADFRQSRGVALTIVTIAPALLGVVLVPVLTQVIETWGWRAGYRIAAAAILAMGLAAIALVPTNDPEEVASVQARSAPLRSDLRLIVRTAPFWIICTAIFLCMLSAPLHSSQMGLMLSEHRLDGGTIAAMISLYGVGTIAGRLVCGVALDMLDPPTVAAVSMFLPAIGYALLAAPFDTELVIGPAMFLVGLAVGAEADLQSFLVARHFDLRIFSTTLSLVYVAVFAASGLGAGLVSLTLKLTGSYDLFLMAMSVAIAFGSLLFLLLARRRYAVRIGAMPIANAR